MTTRAWILLGLFLSAACRQPAPPAKQYQLTGQILGIKAEEREVLVKHDDIEGFMPAMTMPYKVQDAALLKDKAPGDLITATLVVSESVGVLSSLTKTGHAPIDQAPATEYAQPIEVITEGKPIPEQLFVDQEGKARALSALNKGHRLAMTFIYTRCPMPEFCPMMDRHFAALQQSLKASPELEDVRLISVTIDPTHDKPPVLKAHAARLKADPAIWTFLTGDEEEISRFGAQFGLAIVRNANDPLDISHSLRTLVVGPDGRLVKAFTGNDWKPSDLLAQLKAAPAPVQ
jgi:protein SCO1